MHKKWLSISINRTYKWTSPIFEAELRDMYSGRFIIHAIHFEKNTVRSCNQLHLNFFFARSLKEPFVYVQEFLTKFPTEWMTCHSKIKHVTRAKIHMRILKGIENRSEWWSRKGLLLYIFVGINWSWNVENISPWLRPPKSLFSNRLIDTKISKGNSFHEFNPFQVCELKFVLC